MPDTHEHATPGIFWPIAAIMLAAIMWAYSLLGCGGPEAQVDLVGPQQERSK
jgi:hypothetical protein